MMMMINFLFFHDDDDNDIDNDIVNFMKCYTTKNLTYVTGAQSFTRNKFFDSC